MDGPLITTGVGAGEQECEFMNATLNTLGDEELAVSIAVNLPDHMNGMTQDEIAKTLKEDFKHLTDIGYFVEIQIGPYE